VTKVVAIVFKKKSTGMDLVAIVFKKKHSYGSCGYSFQKQSTAMDLSNQSCAYSFQKKAQLWILWL
jgi:hypothetical protein